MNFTKEQKKQVTKHIYSINEMTAQELHSFAARWHLAKPDLEKNVFDIVLRAIDLHNINIKDNTTINALAVVADLGADEDE